MALRCGAESRSGYIMAEIGTNADLGESYVYETKSSTVDRRSECLEGQRQAHVRGRGRPRCTSAGVLTFLTLCSHLKMPGDGPSFL